MKKLSLSKFKNKKILILICAVLVVITAVVLIIILNRKESFRSVTVNDQFGSIDLERNQSVIEIAKDMKLIPNDFVTVGKESLLDLLVDDDKHIAVISSTKFSVDAVGNPKKGLVTINVFDGKTYVKIDNPLQSGDGFQVITPNATISVRGTTFTVDYNPALGRTRVECVEGNVNVASNSGDEVNLAAGESAEVIDVITTGTVGQNRMDFIEYVFEGAGCATKNDTRDDVFFSLGNFPDIEAAYANYYQKYIPMYSLVEDERPGFLEGPEESRLYLYKDGDWHFNSKHSVTDHTAIGGSYENEVNQISACETFREGDVVISDSILGSWAEGLGLGTLSAAKEIFGFSEDKPDESGHYDIVQVVADIKTNTHVFWYVRGGQYRYCNTDWNESDFFKCSLNASNNANDGKIQIQIHTNDNESYFKNVTLFYDAEGILYRVCASVIPANKKCDTEYMKVDTEESKADETETNSELANASIGETISFGNWEHSGYDRDVNTQVSLGRGVDPIEWIVLDKQGNQILLISKYALCPREYHDAFVSVTWENCTLRSWLNNEFLSSVFSSQEQNMIIPTTLSNDDNAEYGTPGGNNTTDKIFLLSIDEANMYFENNNVRMNTFADGTETWWWLRSPGYKDNRAAFVHLDGTVFGYGNNGDNMEGAVRPALWIDVSDH